VNRTQLAGLLWAALSSVLFGASLTVAGAVFEFLEPFEVIGVRMVMAGVLVLPVVLIRREPMGSDWPRVIGVGALMVGVNLAIYMAIPRIGVGPAAGLQFLGPALIVAWKRIFGGLRYPRVMWGAVAVGLLGAGLLGKAWIIESFDPLGIALALLSGAGLATYLVIAEDLNTRRSALGVTSSAVVASALLGVALFPTDLVERVPVESWWLVLWLGSFGLVIPMLIEVTALRTAPSEKVGIVLTLEPFAAAVTAWAFLSQALHPLQATGMALVVAAVLVTGRLRPIEGTQT
jgi:inner membrane transporter RhtA